MTGGLLHYLPFEIFEIVSSKMMMHIDFLADRVVMCQIIPSLRRKESKYGNNIYSHDHNLALVQSLSISTDVLPDDSQFGQFLVRCTRLNELNYHLSLRDALAN